MPSTITLGLQPSSKKRVTSDVVAQGDSSNCVQPSSQSAAQDLALTTIHDAEMPVEQSSHESTELRDAVQDDPREALPAPVVDAAHRQLDNNNSTLKALSKGTFESCEAMPASSSAAAYIHPGSSMSHTEGNMTVESKPIEPSALHRADNAYLNSVTLL